MKIGDILNKSQQNFRFCYESTIKKVNRNIHLFCIFSILKSIDFQIPTKKFIRTKHLIYSLAIISGPCYFMRSLWMSDIFHIATHYFQTFIKRLTTYNTCSQIILPMKNYQWGFDILNIGQRRLSV